MELDQVKRIFSTSTLDYFYYPEAYELVELFKNFSGNSDAVGSEKIQNSVRKLILKDFMIKELRDCKKFYTLTVWFLKIFDFFSSKLSLEKRNRALEEIQHFAEALIKKSLQKKEKNPLIHKEFSLKRENEIPFIDLHQSLKNVDDSINQSRLEELINTLPLPKAIKLAHSYEHHQLCDRMTQISDRLTSSSESTQQLWQTYLQAIDKTALIYPDGYKSRLKTSFAIKWLKNKKPTIFVEQLSHLPIINSSVFCQMIKIERHSFVSTECGSCFDYHVNKHIADLHSRRNRKFFLAYDSSNKNKLVGVLEYDSQHQEISSIARKASYAKSGIGQALWKALSCTLSLQTCQLHVRESNPARAIYEKWGFKITKKLKNYYRQPLEEAFLMERSPPSPNTSSVVGERGE